MGRRLMQLHARALFFLGLLMAISTGNRCPNIGDIELYDQSDPSKFRCWPSFDCPDGHERSVELGSVHPMETVIECRECPEGSFSNAKTNHTCLKCTLCGNKKELANCTLHRDRKCSSDCISNKFYLNTTDKQCYPCSECCGANSNNIEIQCLTSVPLHVGVTRIGQKGAPHCGVKSSQQCDDLNFMQENKKKPKERTGGHSIIDTHVLIIIILSCLCISVVFHFVTCVWLRRSRLRSSHSSCLSFSHNCSPLALSTGGGCEYKTCLPTFQEKLKLIPEDLKIDNIPYEIECLIKNLDGNQPHSKDWYDVGRKLGVSQADLAIVRREDARQGGSPTDALLSSLRTQETVTSLREFVQVLRDIDRHDIANPIISFYSLQKANTETSV